MNSRTLLVGLLVAIGVALGGLAASASDAAPTKDGMGLEIDSIRIGSKAGPAVVRVRAGAHAKLKMSVNGRRVRHGFKFAGRRAHAIELRVADGLRPGANRLRISATHGGRTAVAKRTVRLPRRLLLADAGADSGTIAQVRTRLGTAPVAGRGAAGMRHRWRIVERPRRSKATLRNGNRPQAYLHAKTPGTYVLQLEVDPEGPGPSTFDQVVVPVAPPDPPIGAPLNTIADNGAIKIGDESFGAGGGSAYVVLERTTRHPVASGSVANDGAGIAKLLSVAETWESGANRMNYLMIVSGRSGIPAAQLDAFTQLTRKLGAPLLSEENFAALRDGQQYSLIGIPGGPSGAATIRIPGGYAPPVSGAIVGYLQKNTAIDSDGVPLYDYASPDHPGFDTRAPGGTAKKNTMVVGGTEYTQTLPDWVSAGFHVVVFESLSMRPLFNAVVATNSDGSDRALQEKEARGFRAMTERPGGPTVLVQTIGKPKAAGPEWAGFVEQLGKLGANRQLVNALNGTTEYAFVGRNGFEEPTAESSTAYDSYPAPGNPPARLVGTLIRSRSSNFVPSVTRTPTAASPAAGAETGLVQVAYQAPKDWPPLAPAAKPGEAAAAEKYICESLGFCQPVDSCPSVRACYWQKYSSDWDLKHSVLVGLGFAAGKGFEQKPFETVKQQLLAEIAAVANVRHYLAAMQEPFDRSATRTYVDLQDITQKIWDSVQLPAADNSTASALTWIGKTVALGGFAGPPISGGAAGLAALFSLGSYLSTKPGTPIVGSEIKARASVLGTEMLDRIDLIRKTTTGLGKIIVSDAGKLAEVDKKIDAEWSLPETESTSTILRTASRQWAYEALIPTAFPYLIRANGPNARTLDCGMGSTQAWPNQPDSDQMQATVGYDANGNPIRAGFFFTAGIGGGSSPAAGLGDAMFRPRGGERPGLGIEKLGFFTPRLFGGRIYRAVQGSWGCQLDWLPNKY